MSVVFNEDLDEYVDTDYEAESMKDNTLRNAIAEVLDIHETVAPEHAIEDIIEAIKNRLPKEFTPESYEAKYGKGSFKRDAYEMTGYNAAIAEVKQALDIESES